MPDHTPLTDQQLNEIDARATAATPGPWEPYPGYGPAFYANTTHGSMRGVGDLEFGDGDAAEADEKFVRHAQQDVTALLAYVRRLQEQRQYLIGQLAKRDAESGAGDQALREFLVAHPGEDEMAASMVRDGFGPDEVVDILRRPISPVVGEPLVEACGKFKRPFDPADPSFDGRAQYAATPYCRGCVDRCHDNNSADHRCVICG